MRQRRNGRGWRQSEIQKLTLDSGIYQGSAVQRRLGGVARGTRKDATPGCSFQPGPLHPKAFSAISTKNRRRWRKNHILHEYVAHSARGMRCGRIPLFIRWD
jgi:hypothetical protein